MNCPRCDCFCPAEAEACACGYRFPVSAEATVTPFARKKAALFSLAGKFAGTRRKLFWLAFLACLLLWVLSLFWADRLPAQTDIFTPLYQEPLQTSEDIPAPFQVQKNKLTYIVTPLFRYELYGLVVSEHRSDSLIDVSHRRWQDYLNIKDLCVVWGHNIRSGVYRRMKFWNRDFTCMCRTSDEATARLFSESHLSNNHMLCGDEALSRRILKVRPGDQVHFKGYLASYSQPANQFYRGSSTVRTDRGPGACETVFVTDFTVLRRANPVWRAVNPVAFLASLALLLALLFM